MTASRGSRAPTRISLSIAVAALITLGGGAAASESSKATSGRSNPNTPDRSKPLGTQGLPSQHCGVQINGTWRGWYAYSGNQRRSVSFTAVLSTAPDCRVTGRMQEPNTFGKKDFPTLFATLVGRVEGDTVAFTKTYDGTAGVSHSVRYHGLLSRDLHRIDGNWRIGRNGGRFQMSR